MLKTKQPNGSKSEKEYKNADEAIKAFEQNHMTILQLRTCAHRFLSNEQKEDAQKCSARVLDQYCVLIKNCLDKKEFLFAGDYYVQAMNLGREHLELAQLKLALVKRIQEVIQKNYEYQRISDVLTYCSKLHEIDPEDGLGWYYHASVLIIISQQNPDKYLEFIDKALGYFDKALAWFAARPDMAGPYKDILAVKANTLYEKAEYLLELKEIGTVLSCLGEFLKVAKSCSHQVTEGSCRECLDYKKIWEFEDRLRAEYQPKVDEYHDLAQQCREAGEYSRAFFYIDQILKIFPEQNDAMLLSSEMLLECQELAGKCLVENKYRAALLYAERVLSAEPTNEKALEIKEKASDKYRDSKDKEEHEKNVYYRITRRCIEAEEYLAALFHSQILSDTPILSNNPEVKSLRARVFALCYKKGATFLGEKKYKVALLYAWQILILSPEHKDAESLKQKAMQGCLKSGNALLLKGEYEEALSYAETILRVDPNQGDAFLIKNAANVRLKKPEKRESSYDEKAAEVSQRFFSGRDTGRDSARPLYDITLQQTTSASSKPARRCSA